MRQSKIPYLTGFAASVVVVMIWSGWVVLSRAGMVGAFSVWDLGLLRFGTAAVIVLPLLLWRRKPLSAIFALKIMLPALLGGSAYALFSFAALAQSPAVNAGVVVNGLIPIATICLIFVFARRRPRYRELAISLLIIFANFLLLRGALIPWGSYAMFVAATFSLAFYFVAVSIWNLDSEVSFYAVPIVNTIFIIPCWLLFDGKIEADLGDIVQQAAYQGVLVTLGAVTLLTFALHRIGSVMVAVIMSGVPAMTAILAYGLLGEPITRLHLVVLGLSMTGIVLYAFFKRP